MEIRIKIVVEAPVASDKNLVIEKVRAAYRHINELAETENMTSCIVYTDNLMDINIESFETDDDIDVQDDEESVD